MTGHVVPTMGPFGVRGPSGRVWTVGAEASDGPSTSRRGVEAALVAFLDTTDFHLVRHDGSGAWVPASREELAAWSATDPQRPDVGTR